MWFPRCRRIFSTRKVGHAGTLDPMATGVLVVGIERATKILGLLTATDKSYAATIRLGQTTSTEDADGEVLQTVSAAHVADDDIAAAIAALRGDIDAGAVGGQRHQGRRQARLQARARRPRPSSWPRAAVHIGRFEVLDVRRSDDLRRRRRRGGLLERAPTSGRWPATSAPTLGVGGHLDRAAAHPRRHVRPRRGTHARRPGRSNRPLSYSLDEACLLAFPRRDLTADEAESARHGRALAPAGIDGVYAAMAPDGGSSRCSRRGRDRARVGSGHSSRDAVADPRAVGQTTQIASAAGCPRSTVLRSFSPGVGRLDGHRDHAREVAAGQHLQPGIQS